MANSICLRCPWCKSKNQTMTIIHVQSGSNAPKYMQSSGQNDWYLSVICRSCSAYSRATVMLVPNFGTSPANIISNPSSQYDFTRHLDFVWSQSPQLEEAVSDHVPEVVKEALQDAYDAERPRARCAQFRTAVEFALREAQIGAGPGETLGAILAKAGKNYALPPALLELCDQVKAFGNWGLHWSELKIEESDAEAAQTITEAIVQYLFELPALVSVAATRTAEAKDAHKNG